MADLNIFTTLPYAITVVTNDAPAFTIVALTDEFLHTAKLDREDILSKPFVPVAEQMLVDISPSSLLSLFGEVDMPADLGRNSNGTIPSRQLTLTDHQPFTQVSSKAVHSNDGTITHFILTWEKEPVTSMPDTEMDFAKTANFFKQAPVAIAIVKGPDYVFELANQDMLQFLGRTGDAVGKPLLEVFPEAKLQGLVDIFDYVRQSGNDYNMRSYPATILINGVREHRFFDVRFQRYEQAGNSAEVRIFCVAHNVTEQVQIQQQVEDVKEKLRFRNALLEAVNEATPDGILIVDVEGKVLLKNKRFIETWKIPASVVANNEEGGLIAFANSMLADPAGQLKGITAAREPGQQAGQDVLLLKDGRVLERNGSPVLGDDQVSYGWAWYFRDVTDRIRQEQKFNNVVQQASMPIAILKGENMIVEVANQALLDLWKTDESVIGKPYLKIQPDREEQGLFTKLLEVYRTGQAFYGTEVPLSFDRGNGNKEILFFNFSYQPYREANGSITGVLAWGNDVTDQVMAKQRIVESERNLRNTIYQAPVAMCILKGSDHIVDIANNLMLRFLRKSTDEVQGRPIFDVLPEAKLQGFEQLLEKAYTRGETVSGFGQPLSMSRDNGPETLYISYVFEPFREWDSTISSVMVVIMDVSEQVRAKQQLEQNESELQRRVKERTLDLDQINQALQSSNLSLEEFAYAASHDLKSPIRKINMLAQLLNQELGPALTETQQRIFKRIDDSAGRMLTLIDDLLSFSHISKGAGTFDDIDLSQKLQRVLDDLEIEVLEKNAQITIGELPVLRGNRRQLQQLFQNLISNALKYTKPGVKPEIQILSTLVNGTELNGISADIPRDRAYHLIEVRDNGIGFDQVDAEQIFNVFTRLHTHAEYSGTGVGLSIVKRVVENHNGHVWAESHAGQGASFKILLPHNGRQNA
ncbi:MAG: PAS domain-containing protein [Ferruginibacter sp.]|nr:PAS domain-containing protein [Ferruginibacter sp.]